jgi:uncharacterized membrane protein
MRRALICLGLGLVCGVVTALVWTVALLPLVSWTVGASLAVSWVWWISWRQDGAGTARLAEEENRSASTDMWVVLGCVASLGAVVDALVRSSGKGPVAVAAVLLSLASVGIAGALVNTVFALKYARMYYIDGPMRGGFAFPEGDDQPAYADFAYLAFTVGMAFAVPEARPDQTRTRRVVLGHALLSYVFATGVLAVAIGLLTGLGQ